MRLTRGEYSQEGLGNVGLREGGEFEPRCIKAAVLKLSCAFRRRRSQGFDSAQWQAIGRIDFKRHPEARKLPTLFESEAVNWPSDKTLNSHGNRLATILGDDPYITSAGRNSSQAASYTG